MPGQITVTFQGYLTFMVISRLPFSTLDALGMLVID